MQVEYDRILKDKSWELVDLPPKDCVFHACTKLIEVQYHYVQKLVEDEIVELKCCLQRKIAPASSKMLLEKTNFLDIFYSSMLGQKLHGLFFG